MPFGVTMESIGNTPIYGDNYIRRPAISGASSRRRSAPPRPPRPELNPWPKQGFEASIAEIDLEREEGDDAYGHLYNTDDFVELTPEDFVKQENPGRISPVSEEDVSSAGTNSNNVSPSNSMNKKSDERPILRPRPFSFESLRSAASCYSQDSKMIKSRAESRAAHRDDFEAYADIAMSNPFTFQREIEEMRPYASHTYMPQPEREQTEMVADQDQAAIYRRSTHAASGTSLGRPRPESIAVPMSRYNSRESSHSQHRRSPAAVPSPRAESPDVEVPEPEKTLAEAWEDVKKAVAPKLRVASQEDSHENSLDRHERTEVEGNKGKMALTRATSVRTISTGHALPEAPEPPPVPRRDPRRLQVSRCTTVTSQPAHRSDRQRLSQSTSSPNMSKSFYKQQPDVDDDAPPVPALPSQAEILAKSRTPRPLVLIGSNNHNQAQDNRKNVQNVASNVLARPPSVPSPASSPSSTSSIPASSCTSYSSSVLQHTNANAPHSPLSLSSTNASKRFSYDPSRTSYLSYAPAPLITPPLSHSSSSRHSMGQASSTASEQSSPRSRGFHEPPPVASSIMRFNTVAASNRPANLSLHKANKSDSVAPGPASPGIWAGNKAVGATFTTQIWAQPERSHTTHSLGATLRSILPGESATSKPTPPSRSATQSSSSPATSRSGSTALTSPSQQRTDEFPSLRTIPLASNFNATSADDYLPKFSNNFAGFCKCAWRAQTAQTNKAFTLRTVSMTTQLPNATTTTTKVTTLKCKKCAFEGPLATHPAALAASSSAYASSSDLSRCADPTPHTAHGVVFRWNFLFKSHVPTAKSALRKDEAMDPHSPTTQYACLFCCADGKGTVCFEGAKNLCGHISKCHPRGVMGGGERELRMRVGIVVGRRPDKGEAWDIILPGNRKREDKELKNWL